MLVDCLSEFAFKFMSMDQLELFKIFKEGQDWEKTVDLKGRTMLTKEEWDDMSLDRPDEEQKNGTQ